MTTQATLGLALYPRLLLALGAPGPAYWDGSSCCHAASCGLYSQAHQEVGLGGTCHCLDQVLPAPSRADPNPSQAFRLQPHSLNYCGTSWPLELGPLWPAAPLSLH